MLIEDAPCDGVHDAHDDGTGHDDKAGHRSRKTHEVLDVDGHEHGCHEQGCLNEHADDGRDEEVAIEENTHAQHWRLEMQLPEEEPDDACTTNENGDTTHEIDAIGTKDAEPIEQAAKAQRGEHDGKRVKRRVAFGLGTALLDEEGGSDDDHGDKPRDDVEHDVPVDRIDHDARNRGADGRGEGNDETEDAHGRTPAVDGKHDEQDGHRPWA